MKRVREVLMDRDRKLAGEKESSLLLGVGTVTKKVTLREFVYDESRETAEVRS